jgi:hypothetical protein
MVITKFNLNAEGYWVEVKKANFCSLFTGSDHGIIQKNFLSSKIFLNLNRPNIIMTLDNKTYL